MIGEKNLPTCDEYLDGVSMIMLGKGGILLKCAQTGFRPTFPTQFVLPRRSKSAAKGGSGSVAGYVPLGVLGNLDIGVRLV